MRRFRSGIIILAAVLMGSAPAKAAPRIGSVRMGPDTSACVTFRAEDVRIGNRLLIVLFSPPRIVDGVVQRVNKGSCNRIMELPGTAYQVALRHPIGEEGELGIAVLDATARAEYADGEFVVYTKGASSPLAFRSCASHEGIHLWTLRASRETWREYWYVGFDLEPTCPDVETKE